MARQRTDTKNIDGLKKELQNLRSDFIQLGKQVEAMANDTSGEVMTDVKARIDRFASDVDDLIASASARGREAIGAVGEAGENVLNSVEDHVHERPLTSLAVAVGLGFLLSSTMRR
jgi:ElaB/YqjD/DUF883 family membrane-anchored ribosome-binding protein